MHIRVTMLFILIVLLPACAASRAVINPQAKLELTADQGLNPDAQGRPSPLALKIYELTARTEFDLLDFDDAFYNADARLGAALLSATELMILPNEALQHRIELKPEVKFVAIVGAYRAIDQANWKLIYPVNSHYWRQTHAVRLQANGFELVD